MWLVVIDKNTVAISTLSDYILAFVFAVYLVELEILAPAEVNVYVFFMYVHNNYAWVAYDPAALGSGARSTSSAILCDLFYKECFHKFRLADIVLTFECDYSEMSIKKDYPSQCVTCVHAKITLTSERVCTCSCTLQKRTSFLLQKGEHRYLQACSCQHQLQWYPSSLPATLSSFLRSTFHQQFHAILQGMILHMIEVHWWLWWWPSR